MLPESVRNVPQIAPNSVDLPAPFAPMIVMKSPSATESDRSSRAVFEMCIRDRRAVEVEKEQVPAHVLFLQK